MLSGVRPPEIFCRLLSLVERSGLIVCQLWPPFVVRCTCWLVTNNVFGSCGENSTGNVHWKRYFNDSAGQPPVLCGQTSTFRTCRVRTSMRVTMPPRAPEPEALDHTTLGSFGSGVANPLSPPPTANQSPRAIPPPYSELLGPLVDGPSWRFPMTLYGIALSTVTWYICAMGRCTRCQVSPRLLLMPSPWSLPPIMRLAFFGSIQRSWWSPPGLRSPPWFCPVRPPSIVFTNDAVRKYASSGSSVETRHWL